MSGKDIKEVLWQSATGTSLRKMTGLLEVTQTTVNRWFARCSQLNLDYEAGGKLSYDKLRQRVVISKGPKLQDSAIEEIERYYESLNNGYSILECYEQYREGTSGSSDKVLSQASFYQRLNRYAERIGAQTKCKTVSQ